jgi:hypothetical protein
MLESSLNTKVASCIRKHAQSTSMTQLQRYFRETVAILMSILLFTRSPESRLRNWTGQGDPEVDTPRIICLKFHKIIYVRVSLL